MNTTVQEKIEYVPSMIYSLNMQWKENYVVYDDSDSQTDYFHSTRGSADYMAKVLRQSGADLVIAEPVNNDNDPKYERRVKIIAKKAGYAVTRKDEKKEYADYQGVSKEWTKIEFHMVRNDDNPRHQESLAENKRVLDIQTEQLINTPMHQRRDVDYQMILNLQRTIRGLELNQ